MPVFVCGRRDRLEAFCTWLPYADGAGMVLDLLRRRHEARAGSREMLLGWSLEALAAAGVRELSLGLAPVPPSPDGRRALACWDRARRAAGCRTRCRSGR